MFHKCFFTRLFAIYFNLLLILHYMLTFASGIANIVSTKFYDGISQFTMQKYAYTIKHMKTTCTENIHNT